MKESKKKRNINNMELYSLYIVPNINFIESLIKHYSTLPNQYDEVFSYVMQTFEDYIDTYNPSKSIDTWIHIVTKRQVMKYMKTNQKKIAIFPPKGGSIDYNETEFATEYESPKSTTNHADPLDMEYYRVNLDDEIYNAMLKLKEIHRVPLILKHIEGWSIQDITEFEFKRGTIGWLSISAIKTRIKVSLENMRKYIEQERKAKKDEADKKADKMS